MSLKHNVASRLLAVCALATLSLMAVAQAQPTDRGRGDRDGRGLHDGPGHDGPRAFRAHVQPSLGGVCRMANRSSGTDDQAD